MKRMPFIFILMTLAQPSAVAQITRVATFENFTPGDNFAVSFTDPVSGITFRDSTHPPPSGFVVNFSPTYFGGGNYLTSGVIAIGGLGGFFGFTADLPAPADRVSLDAVYLAQPRSDVLLQGFNSVGNLIAEETGPSGLSNSAFSLEITSSQFDITSFRVSVGGGSAGYDNISYTIIPEPHFMALVIATMIAGRPIR